MDPFVAEIRMVPFNFAPTGWAFCNGQLLPISQNTALFSLLGTVYGGDGKSTFALPNMQGSTPMHPNFPQPGAPGLSQYFLGEQGGVPYVTLLTSEMPSHIHGATPRNTLATAQLPENQTWAGNADALQFLPSSTVPNTTMNPGAMAPTGGSQPHNNMQPYLTVNFIIALQGVFPARP